MSGVQHTSRDLSKESNRNIPPVLPLLSTLATWDQLTLNPRQDLLTATQFGDTRSPPPFNVLTLSLAGSPKAFPHVHVCLVKGGTEL